MDDNSIAVPLVRRTKLIRPRLGAGLIPRSHLIERLNRGLDNPLILLSTPAGYGKTTLLCQWLADCPLRSTWLAVDERDNNLSTFIAELVAALHVVAPELGQATLGLLRLPQEPTPAYLATTFADELLTLAEPLIVVLDDFHHIADLRVHAFVGALLDYPPPSLRLALTTRADPLLPLARWRGRDRMTELRADDLRFTPEEVRDFLAGATAGQPAPPAVAQRLGERVEGWATGLRLAALALRDGSDSAAVEAMTGRRQQRAMHYLRDEVVAGLPPTTQTFLRRTSIVQQVCAPLADALLDEPPVPGTTKAMLERLVQSNLFVMALDNADGHQDWCRYHQLFRDLLHAQLLEREGAAGVAALHRRAADWFLDQAMVEDALGHLLAAGDVERAAVVVEGRSHAVLNRDDWVTLERWVQRLPEELVQRRLALALVSAWTALLRGRYDVLPVRLARATELLDQADREGSSDVADALRGDIDAIWAVIGTGPDGSASTAAAARRALERLPAERVYVRGLAYLHLGLGLQQLGQRDMAVRDLEAAVALSSQSHDGGLARLLFGLAVVELLSANLPAARRWSERCLAAGAEAGLILSVTWANYIDGRVAYEWNDLDEARRSFEAALKYRHQANLLTTREATFGLALTYHAEGRASEAQALLNEFEDFLRATTNVEHLPLVRCVGARLALASGDQVAADRWLETSGPPGNASLRYVVIPDLTRVRVLLGRGASADRAAAEALLATFRTRAEREHATWCVIETLALQALGRWAAGDEAAAFGHLEQALTLAEPGGFMRTFVDLGAPLAALLQRLAERRGLTSYRRRVLAALAATPTTPAVGTAGDPDRVLVDRLTSRELQVLECLGVYLTNKEIAAELSISPMTVKRHVSHILDKFGASSRRQVVRRARALGLLTRQPPA